MWCSYAAFLYKPSRDDLSLLQDDWTLLAVHSQENTFALGHDKKSSVKSPSCSCNFGYRSNTWNPFLRNLVLRFVVSSQVWRPLSTSDNFSSFWAKLQCICRRKSFHNLGTFVDSKLRSLHRRNRQSGPSQFGQSWCPLVFQCPKLSSGPKWISRHIYAQSIGLEQEERTWIDPDYAAVASALKR